MEERYTKPLRMCVWELTLRCNARCRLCGSKAKDPRPNELSTPECIDLAKEMIDLGMQTLTLSGGEPLLRDGLFDIARVLIDGGVTTDVISNGLLIDDEMALRLSELGLNGVTLSFDGIGLIHDELRGVKGSYTRLVKAVDALRKYNVNVGAITHVNQTNLPHLFKMADTLPDIGVMSWRLQLTVPVDDRPESMKEMLRPSQLSRVADAIHYTQKNGKMACSGSHDTGYYGFYELDVRWHGKNGPRVWHGCPAGIEGIGMMADGGVNGCLSLLTHGNRFYEGNIKERSLTEIWQDPDSFAYNRKFKEEDRGGTCRACRFLSDCRGGCLNQLAAVDRDLKENPLCLYAVEKDKAIPGVRPDNPKPSIVLFVADGLRPDFLGCYGKEQTPNIDRLAKEGLLVKHGRSQAAWTVPAVASLFTGMNPLRLGLVKWRQGWDRAPGDLFSLLRLHGYNIGSFPFDRRHLFSNQPQAKVVGTSWDLTGVTDWIVGNHLRPSFTYVHWWGTHAPYIKKRLSLKHWQKSTKLLTDALDRDRRFADKLRQMYRLSIQHLDQVVLPQIINAIEKGRGWENTIFVLTADHGESWCERYDASRKVQDVFDFHGRALYEENLRIPMIFSGAVESGQVDGPATHADLCRTLAQQTGSNIPSDYFCDGMNLLNGLDESRPVFAVADRDFVDAKAVPTDPNQAYLLFSCLKGDQKIIRHVGTDKIEWYDLSKDPGETKDLVAEGKSVPAELLAIMDEEWKKAVPLKWNPDEEAAIRRNLKSLGYM